MQITNTFMQNYVKDIDKAIDTHTYKKLFCLYNHSKADLTGFMLTPYSFQRRFFSKSCRSFLKYFKQHQRKNVCIPTLIHSFIFSAQLQLLIPSVDKPFCQTFPMGIKKSTYFNIAL